jgi:hypothetical protein
MFISKNEYLEIKRTNKRAEELLRRNDKELNEVKHLFSNKIYHSMKELGGDYCWSDTRESCRRNLHFSYGEKDVEVSIKVSDQ